MAFDAHKNFAVSLVATAPSPAASGTSLIVTAGEGVRFPAVAFNAVVFPAGQMPTPANAEIVRVTAIATDTFTITRTQESSVARTIVVGDIICAAITAKTLSDIEASPVFSGTPSAAGGFVATATGANAGFLVGAAAGNWGARVSRSAGGAVLLGLPGTTSADHFNIVSSAGTDLVDIDGTGAIKFNAYTVTTFVAADKYLVIDASGNIHRSAIGPAS